MSYFIEKFCRSFNIRYMDELSTIQQKYSIESFIKNTKRKSKIK